MSGRRSLVSVQMSWLSLKAILTGLLWENAPSRKPSFVDGLTNGLKYLGAADVARALDFKY